MSKSYKITSVDVVDGLEVKVNLKCKSSDIDEFDHSACFPYNADINDILARLDSIANDAINTKKTKKIKEEGLEAEKQEKIHACNLLKAEIESKV